MSTATIVYSRSFGITTPLIRHADRWGRWSHAGIVTPGLQNVVEARALRGVVVTPYVEFVERATQHDVVEIEVPDLAAGLAWLEPQIGKGYDYRAVAGHLFRQSWEDEDRWHCAELVEAFLAACGRRRFRHSAWRISPNNSWSVV